jgi:poly-gamma-glutamate synthesis protein (capsule biosynthesis protein)
MAVGDIGLGREVNYQIITNKIQPFINVEDLFLPTELVFANLEGPLIESCPINRQGFTFCGLPDNASLLDRANIRFISLANNHILNYGSEGLSETFNTLDKYNIYYSENNNILYKTMKGTTFALLSFDDIVRRVDIDTFSEIIRTAKHNADFVIVSFHWGEEYQPLPNQRQKDLANIAAENGVNLIIGHHPHVLQTSEWIDNTLVFYSLGNFLFDQFWSLETRIGAIAKIEISDGQISKVEIIPTILENNFQIDLINDQSKLDIIKHVTPQN